MKDGKKKIVILIASLLSIYIGYLVGGVMGLLEIMPDNLSGCITSVLSHPFEKYFNDYTPITMILCLVIFEFFCILSLSMGKGSTGCKKSQAVKQSKASERKSTEPSEDKEQEHRMVDFLDDEVWSNPPADKPVDAPETDEKELMFVSVDEINHRRSAGENADAVMDETDEQSFSEEELYSDEETTSFLDDMNADDLQSLSAEYNEIDDIYADLYVDYSTEQIDEMIRIKEFNADIDAMQLRKMFSPEMSAASIKEYIDIFYG